MKKQAEAFIYKFHNLQGTTVAQRRKIFFLLLHEHADLRHNSSIVDMISSNLIPKTYLEELFRVDFLIFFRRNHELFQLLREGNDVFVSKIIKQAWFCQEYFAEMSPTEIVNETLPNLSFSVRIKLLRKLSRYLGSHKFDLIFDFVAARYGTFTASKFLAGCSAKKIRNFLQENSIKLTLTQLKILYRKDPGLIRLYFNKPNVSLTYRLMQFLFINDRKLHDELQDSFNYKYWLGRRSTKKIVEIDKEAMIGNLEHLDIFKRFHMNVRTVLRKIGPKDSIRLFRHNLPLKFNSWEIVDLLRWFPEKYHYNLFFNVITKHYNKDPLDLIDSLREVKVDILTLIPNNLERALYGKSKVEQGDDEFIKYLETKDSIPLLQNKINSTQNICRRRRLIEQLVATCHINKDLDALLHVMKYFNFKHRNDDARIHMIFLYQIDDLFGFKDFTEEMWNCLNELLIHQLQDDKESSLYVKVPMLSLVRCDTMTSSHQKLSYLNFVFNRKECISDLMAEYFSGPYSFPWWGTYGKEFEKYLLTYAIENAMKIIPATDEPLPTNLEPLVFKQQLIDQIDKWNSHYHDDQLSLYDYPILEQSFHYCLENYPEVLDFGTAENFDDYRYNFLENSTGTIKRIIRKTVFSLEDNQHRIKYIKLYWQYYQSLSERLKDLKWFLKYDPEVIVNNFDKFYNIQVQSVRKHHQLQIWYLVKKLTHLGLDEESIKQSMFNITSKTGNNDFKKKPGFIACLSVLMKPQDFASIAEKYKPENKPINVKSEGEMSLHQLRIAFAKNFKNTKCYQIIPSLLLYCTGDYLRFSLRSIYSLLSRTPESLLSEYLVFLGEQAVSVRKHALYLTCELTTVEEVEKIIDYLRNNETVPSLRKSLVASTIKYFIKNPSEHRFDMVKLNMNFVRAVDAESLETLTRKYLKSMPNNYKTRYIQYCWEFLEKIIKSWNKVEPLKNNLLDALTDEEVKQFPLSFCCSVIQKHFMSKESLKGLDTFQFFIGREEKKVLLDIILGIMDKCDEDQTEAFFSSWYHKIMALKRANLQYFEPFLHFFYEKVNPLQEFLVYVKLKLLTIKLKMTELSTKDETYDEIFNFIISFRRFGVHVLPLIANEIKEVVPSFTNKNNIYEYFLDFLKKHSFPEVGVVVLTVSPKPSDNKELMMFEKIVEEIRNMPDNGVQALVYSNVNN